MAREVRAAVIVIGNEILSGRTQDVNVSYIARGLKEVGVRLWEVRIVPDDETEIVAAVNALRETYAYVFTTGGIGATHDDITARCIAKAFGVAIRRNPDAVAALRLQGGSRDLDEVRFRMADIPEGATLIDNPISHAPGFQIGNVYVMAGVPGIMRVMFDGIKGTLHGGARFLSKSVTLFTTEGIIADPLADLQRRRSETEIGSYPSVREDGSFQTVIVVSGTNPDVITATVSDVRDIASERGVKWKDDGFPPA